MRSRRAGLLASIALALIVAFGWTAPSVASAATRGDVPSVLVIDSCLGDYDLCSLHWLGNDPVVIAEQSHTALASSADPAWWRAGGGEGDAPDTFVLGSATTEAVSVEDIAWALDQIRSSGGEPRTFVVAMGATGLLARQYAEDLASTTQSSRADVVGIAFCGTPHNGYSALLTYPELDTWEDVLGSVGAAKEDLIPGSAYLQRLNEGTLPAVCKTLVVSGAVGDLGFGQTDGLAVAEDLTLPTSATNQVQYAQANVTAAEAPGLTGAWSRFVSEIDYPDRAVDGGLVERLSAIAPYAESPDVQDEVQEFYQAWFDEGTPVTHNATAVLFDLSGSMLDEISPGQDKLAAAKVAAKEYLRAMQAVSELPQAAPMDVSVIGFAETPSTVAEGYDRNACDAIEGMQAWGETDIGLALDKALSYLDGAPTCAACHMLLLSDGASTQGQSEEQMLAGPVARAKAAGIAIDTIGFGDIGESDAGFLRRVSEETGGTYYLAQDTYSLKVNFLTSYYSSLGLALVDQEVASGSTVEVGRANERVSALQVSVVSQRDEPQVRVLCDDEPLDEERYTIQEEYGLVTVQVIGPQPGTYALELSGETGSMHVFAIREPGIATSWHATEAKQDHALYLVIGGAAVLVAAIGIVVARTLSRRGRPAGGGASMSGGTFR